MLRLSIAAAAAAATVVVSLGVPFATAEGGSQRPVPGGAIKHVMVIDLENEDFNNSFGPTSPAKYLNDVLVPQGQLLTNYYATGHFSTDNYLAQISGQAPNQVSGNDCITNTTTFASTYTDVTPGTLDPEQRRYPGQVDGSGCVYPAAVATIGNQLDALDRGHAHSLPLTWRQYAEDMGNDPARDQGTLDPLGGTDCAHPATGGTFPNTATTTDQYAIRHVPFLFFHSVTDNTAYCAQHVVPLGTLTSDPHGDMFSGHLAQDLAQQRTTPAFSMVTPNVCNDGHDATCIGVNAEGGHAGGLVGADLWLKHWMPVILNSPAYRSGQMLVVVTFDEAGVDATACCNEQPGPDNDNPGYPPLSALFSSNPPPTGPGQYPGGGRVGAVLLSSKWIAPGSVNDTPYNHYSALRSYEDLLGITTGGSDGRGHLGFAGQAGLRPFGPDVFDTRPSNH
ncbi:MAG TPA: alkaline phosphatase family protein [Jatrophihabitantaceae bacterium]